MDGSLRQAVLHAKREPYWITGEASRAAIQQLRWAADAVLTGVDTVIADDPLLTDRSGNRRRRPLLRVVLDSGMRMPLDSKLVDTAKDDVVVFSVPARDGDKHAAEMAAARMDELRRRGVRVEVMAAEGGRVPLTKVLAKLGSEGILSVLTETGTRLNTALLAAGLVDRIEVFCSPQILGRMRCRRFAAWSCRCGWTRLR